MKRRPITIALAVGLVFCSTLGFSGAAHALPPTPLALWTISTAAPGILYSVDPSTGATTAVGTGTGINTAIAVALNPATGSIMVLDQACNLFAIDLSTGTGTSTGHTLSATIAGQPLNNCDSMTIGADGTGYASVQTASNFDSYFVSFDPQTGATTPLGPVMNDYYDWMAFDPTSGTLYGQNDNSGDVYSMDPATGVETHVSAFSPYSYNLVIFSDGSFLGNDYYDLVSGSISTWSGSVVGPFSAPLDSQGSNAFFTSTDVFPASLTPASQSVTGVQGSAISSTPAIARSHFSSPPTFTVSPGLPAGLVLDPTTGVVSGIPSAAQSLQVYTITASNGTQSATVTISIAVTAALAATGVDGAALSTLGAGGVATLLGGAALVFWSRRRRSYSQPG